MLLFLGIFLIILFGLLLSLFIVSDRIQPLARLGLAYILGFGVLTVLMFFALYLKMELSSKNLTFGLVIINLLLLIVLLKRVNQFARELKTLFRKMTFSKIELILLLVIILINVYSIAMSIYWPINDWDAITLYDFRAKIFSNLQLSNSYFNLSFDGYYYGYPPLISLAHTFVSVMSGSNPAFVSSFFFVSLSLLFYGLCREVAARFTSLVVTFLLILNVDLIQHSLKGYSNLPFAVYYGIGTLFLFLWILNKNKGYFVISGILVGLSLWTRDTETFWLANLVLLFVYSIYKKNLIYLPAYFALIYPLKYVWGTFKSPLGEWITTRLINDISIVRFGEVINFLWNAVSTNYLPFLICFLIVVILDIKGIFKKLRIWFLFLILLNFCILILGTYILSFTFPDWQRIPGSVSRIFMFFPVLIYFYLANVFDSIFLKK
jgi:hypothetical protein